MHCNSMHGRRRAENQDARYYFFSLLIKIFGMIYRVLFSLGVERSACILEREQLCS